MSASPSLERRGAPRLPIGIEFKYRISSSLPGVPEAMVFDAVSKNISGAGLLFENNALIPLDTELKLTLAMPGVARKKIDVEAKVKRIERISSRCFDIGVTFINVEEDSKEVLAQTIDRLDILRLLGQACRKDISDLHLTANSPPMVRSYGQIKPLDGEPLTGEEIKQLISSILTQEQKRIVETNKDLDFAFSPFPDCRFRVSIYQQRGISEVVFRNILPMVKTRQELGLPEVVDDLCQLKEGIIFIAGPTGSGKTTTINAMVDIINKTRNGVILTLEQPLEYLHKNVKSIVKQREVGLDVESFAKGLRVALRQDPDVIVVGEILDCESLEAALQAAETGHLVISSVHAPDTLQVFERVLSMFSMPQQDFICTRLSYSLKAVIAQKLLPHKSGKERVLATEVCVASVAIKRTIFNKNFQQLQSFIQTGGKFKMYLMKDSIRKLFEQDLIGAETYDMYSKGLEMTE